MNVGDPKKAIVLAAVAVGVVTMAVFRSIPSGPPAPAAAKPATSEKPAEEPIKEEPEKVDVVVDSFSHPNLATPKTPAPKTPAPTPKTQIRPAGVDVRGVFGPKVKGEVLGDPRESAGNDQQEKEERAPVAIRLESIVRTDSAFAMFDVGGAKSAPLAKGAPVAEGIRIIRINESSVVVAYLGKETEIHIGQEVKL